MHKFFALIVTTALVLQCGVPAVQAHIMHLFGGRGGGSSGILELLAAGFIAKLLSEDHEPYHYHMPMMHYPMPMYMMGHHGYYKR